MLPSVQEIFQGMKYKMSVEEEGFVHKLVISNPTTNDMGKFTCDINNIATSAFLDVDGEFISIRFTLQVNHASYQVYLRTY